jgi:hypothetical protein
LFIPIGPDEVEMYHQQTIKFKQKYSNNSV